MWIARDYNGSLRLHLVRPKKQGWIWNTEDYVGSKQSITLREDLYPKLKWTDNPIEVEFKKK